MRSTFSPTSRVLSLCLTAAFTLGLVTLAAPPVHADEDVYLDTDDYKEGEEVVDVFLGREEYSIMVEDIERNGEQLDWGWVLTSAGDRPVQEPKELAFDLSDYSTVRVPEVENFAGVMKDEELASVRDALEGAAKQLGLEAVESGDADLELKAVVVDLSRKNRGFGLIKIDPYIELEIRLRDLRENRDLLLLRNQEHADTPEDAAFEYASQMARFLR